MSKIQSGCSSDCLHCAESGCAKRLVEPEKVTKKAEDETTNVVESKEEENNGKGEE